MKVNVYSQELTPEVQQIKKLSDAGVGYVGARLILHPAERLHHTPADDDRSSVTFWRPTSAERRESSAQAFEEMARIFREPDDVSAVIAQSAIVRTILVFSSEDSLPVFIVLDEDASRFKDVYINHSAVEEVGEAVLDELGALANNDATIKHKSFPNDLVIPGKTLVISCGWL